jgi:hypothetical protein
MELKNIPGDLMIGKLQEMDKDHKAVDKKTIGRIRNSHKINNK